MPQIFLGKLLESIVEWLKTNCDFVFKAIRVALETVIDFVEYLLLLPPDSA